MQRVRIDFETFKEHFIEKPDGFFPVYSRFESDYHGEYLRLLKLDMICEWRLDDGMIKFIEVPFDTEEQYKQLISYLLVVASMLNKAIINNIGRLEPFNELKPESEAIPFL